MRSKRVSNAARKASKRSRNGAPKSVDKDCLAGCWKAASNTTVSSNGATAVNWYTNVFAVRPSHSWCTCDSDLILVFKQVILQDTMTHSYLENNDSMINDSMIHWFNDWMIDERERSSMEMVLEGMWTAHRSRTRQSRVCGKFSQVAEMGLFHIERRMLG